MLNVFSFLKPLFELNVFPSPQKPNILLLTWGFGIFFSVTFFLSEALTKSQLQQSIKDPFYTSDWKVILRPFIVSLLLIFSLYLTGFNATNPFNLLSITIANGIMILFLPSILFFIYKRLYKKKSFYWKSYWKSYVMPLYKGFLWVCLTAATFFSGSIALYKQFMGNDLHCLIVWASLILIAYSIFIMVSCDLFIKFIKLLHDKEEDGTYWTIFYTDPSQEKSVFEIITNEIIKDSEGYYCIPDSNRPGITQMIPISSIIRIDKHTESSGVKMEDSVESSERMCLKENPMNPDIPTESKKKKDKDKKDQKKNKK